MKLSVQTYSGHKAEQRPVRFSLDDHEYTVEEVLDQWYGPDYVYFKVCAQDGGVYILRQQTSTPEGAWELVSFRSPA